MWKSMRSIVSSEIDEDDPAEEILADDFGPKSVRSGDDTHTRGGSIEHAKLMASMKEDFVSGGKSPSRVSLKEADTNEDAGNRVLKTTSQSLEEASDLSKKARDFLAPSSSSSLSKRSENEEGEAKCADKEGEGATPGKKLEDKAFVERLNRERAEAKEFLEKNEKAKEAMREDLAVWRAGIQKRLDAAKSRASGEKIGTSTRDRTEIPKTTASSSKTTTTTQDIFRGYRERMSQGRKMIETRANLAYLDRQRRLAEATAVEKKSVVQLLAEEEKTMKLARETVSRVSQILGRMKIRRMQSWQPSSFRDGDDSMSWISKHHIMSNADAGLFSPLPDRRQFERSRDLGTSIFRKAYAFQPSPRPSRLVKAATSYARIKGMCDSMGASLRLERGRRS